MIRSAGRFLAALAVLALGIPQTASAQQGAVELGVDAGIEYDIVDDVDGVDLDNLFAAALPGQRFRVGFFVSDRVAFEPKIRFNYMDQGDFSTTDFGLDGGLAYHFSDDPDATRGFIHGGGIWNMFDTSESDSQSQFAVYAGLGAKVPAVEMLAVRFEGNVLRAFETDDAVAYWGLQALLGLSFFVN